MNIGQLVPQHSIHSDHMYSYEFASTVRHYFGDRWYYLFQVLYNLALQASNIAAMIISAQVHNPIPPHNLTRHRTDRSWMLSSTRLLAILSLLIISMERTCDDVNAAHCDGQMDPQLERC